MSLDGVHDVLVHEVVRMTFELTGRLRAHMDRVAAAKDLTPMQARAIFVSQEPVPMGALAGALHCDASNVTGIVDRLEERGLMERVVDPADRRRKNLVLTADGRAVREDLEALARAGNPILSLDVPDLEVLHGLLLDILAADVPPEPHLCDHPGVGTHSAGPPKTPSATPRSPSASGSSHREPSAPRP